jgi:hypothetical protein
MKWVIHDGNADGKLMLQRRCANELVKVGYIV